MFPGQFSYSYTRCKKVRALDRSGICLYAGDEAPQPLRIFIVSLIIVSFYFISGCSFINAVLLKNQTFLRAHYIKI